MTTALKGNTTEARVLSALVERDFAVLLPFGEGHPYDLVIHLEENAFLRVQCKTARENHGCVVFNCRSTDHGRGRVSYLGQADLFGAHYPPTGAVYLAPVDEFSEMFEVRLRIDPTLNNQQRGVRFAFRYEVAQWTLDRFRRLLQRAPDPRPTLPEGRSWRAAPVSSD